MKGYRFLRILKIALFGTLAVTAVSFVVMGLWNILMPTSSRSSDHVLAGPGTPGIKQAAFRRVPPVFWWSGAAPAA
jgi:hypothetical protein